MAYTGDDLLHPVLRERLDQLHELHPIRRESGHRSYERQLELWEAHQRDPKHNATANYPGQSNHEAIPITGPAMALACDIHPLDGDYDAMHVAAATVGLHFPIAGESWHAQPVEVRSSKFTGNPFPPQPPPQGDDDMGLGPASFDVGPGEAKTVKITEPGGGASGGGYADHVYLAIGCGRAKGGTPEYALSIPGYWAVFDKAGKWLAGGGEKSEFTFPGDEFDIDAATAKGAVWLTVENRSQLGVLTVSYEWARKPK